MVSCKATTKCFTGPKKWRCPQSGKLCYVLYCDPCESLAFHSPSNTVRSGRNYQIPSRRWTISQSNERLVWPMCAPPESTFKVVTMAAREGQVLRPRVCLLFLTSERRSNSSPSQSGGRQQAAKVLSWDFWGHKVRSLGLRPGCFHSLLGCPLWEHSRRAAKKPHVEPCTGLQSIAPAEFLTHSSRQLPGTWGYHLKCPAHQTFRCLKPQLTSECTTWDTPRDSHPDEWSQPLELRENTKWWL